MKTSHLLLLSGGLLSSGAAMAAETAARPLNWNAIGMFLVFVLFTLGITRWAALRTRSASDFYTAGGGISGLQNGLAIAGDMISAASFLGISAMIFMAGYVLSCQSFPLSDKVVLDFDQL